MAAHLRPIEHRCEWPGCSRTASVQLYNTRNAPMGRYCREHGNTALRDHRRTRHQAFMQEVDAKVARQVREEWAALRAGDRVVVMLDGRRQAGTVVALEQPDLRVRTDDDRVVVVTRYGYVGMRGSAA